MMKVDILVCLVALAKAWTVKDLLRSRVERGLMSAEASPLVLDMSHLFDKKVNKYIFEVAWLQDFSSSYEESLAELQKTIPQCFQEVQRLFPDSRFALGGFVDKPLEPYGFEGSADYCYRLKYPLTSNVTKIEEALKVSLIHSGNDWKESQLHGMLGLALDKRVGWTNFDGTDDNRDVRRLLIVMTDSIYHSAGDASHLPDNNADGFEDCVNEDYPTVAQVKKALDEKHITPVFIVGQHVAPVYKQLVHLLGDRGVVSINKELDASAVERGIVRGVTAVTRKSFKKFNDEEFCEGDSCCAGGNCDEDAAVVIKLAYAPKKLKVLASY